jgi:hypothetical protein
MRFQNTLAFFHLNQLKETTRDFSKIDSYENLTLLAATNCQTCLMPHHIYNFNRIKKFDKEIKHV